MNSSIKSKRLRIDGMVCVNCQNKIEKKLRNTAGIQSVNVSYSTRIAELAYDMDIVSLRDLCAVIEKLGYTVPVETERQASNTSRIIGLLMIIGALFFLIQQFGLLNLLAPSQLADTNMGYGMLFIIGLITSVHCVAMCGGINLSQCITPSQQAPMNPSAEKAAVSARSAAAPQTAKGHSRSRKRNARAHGGEGKLVMLRPTFLYNLGRVISYTTIGFIVGALGSAITFSNAMQGGLKLLAGVFMVVMGVSMLGIFPWLHRLVPRMPRFLARKIDTEKSASKSPLIVGLLNGLIPCGPLQAMQVYALSTGSPFAGALSMFLFSAGTVPLMFGLGALSTILSRKFTRRIMTAGAVLVVVLGLSIFSQGWSLSGISFPNLIPQGAAAQGPQTGAPDAQIEIENGVQTIRSTLSRSGYPSITVQAGTPVKWLIDAPQGSINGCNNRMRINEYDIEHSFSPGENVIEFTPAKPGTVRYSCWMGMIRGTINVIDAGSAPSAAGETKSSTEGADRDALEEISSPVPAGIAIVTDRVAIAKRTVDTYGNDIQEVDIELTEQGFSPAIVVVQAGRDTKWNIINKSTDAANGSGLLIPAYNTQLTLGKGDNALYVYPTASFDFLTEDNVFFGYVKVVDQLEEIDLERIKAEAAAFETLIYPPGYFIGTGNGASCH